MKHVPAIAILILTTTAAGARAQDAPRYQIRLDLTDGSVDVLGKTNSGKFSFVYRARAQPLRPRTRACVRVRGPQSDQLMTFEELHRAFVFLRGCTAPKRPEVASSPGLRILLS